MKMLQQIHKQFQKIDKKFGGIYKKIIPDNFIK